MADPVVRDYARLVRMFGWQAALKRTAKAHGASYANALDRAYYRYITGSDPTPIHSN